MIAHVISSPQDSRKLDRAPVFVANFDRKFLIPIALWIQKLEICFKAEQSFNELINTAVR